MMGMFAFDGDSILAVRQPEVKVSFGSDEVSGGLTAAVGLEQDLDDPWAGRVVSVDSEAGIGPFVDVVTMNFKEDGSSPKVTLDDKGTVALGYADSAIDLVFTAKVTEVKRFILGTTRICAVNGGAILSRLRVNQSYEQQAAGDIVSDLAGQVGVDTDTIRKGPKFAYYVVDDRQNAYQHISTLARKSGYVAYFTTQGKLNFAPLSESQPIQTFRYGQDIIKLQVNESTPLIDGVTFIGGGAAGSQGQEAWPWLVKDPSPITVQAGTGNGGRLVRDPSLRSAEAIKTAADAAVLASGHDALTGRIVVPGAPTVTVGSTIAIADAPNAALNGNCLVMRVRHEFSKLSGFVSRVDFSKSANGNALSGMGGIL
jgi:phage protein D